MFRFLFGGKYIGIIACATGVGILLSLMLPLSILVIIEGILLACVGFYILKCGL